MYKINWGQPVKLFGQITVKSIIIFLIVTPISCHPSNDSLVQLKGGVGEDVKVAPAMRSSLLRQIDLPRDLPTEKELIHTMIESSWYFSPGTFSGLVKVAGGVDAFRDLIASPRGEYPWGVINDKVFDFQLKYGFVDQNGTRTNRDFQDVSQEALNEWDSLMQEIKPLISQKNPFLGFKVLSFFAKCGMKPFNLKDLPSEVRETDLYRNYRFGNVYLFHDESKKHFTLMNVTKSRVQWKTLTLAKFVFNDQENDEAVVLDIQVQPPRVDFFNYIQQILNEKKCPAGS